MLKKYLLRLKAKHIEALREQKGQSIIIFVFAFLGLIAMLGLALDLGLVYIERVKVGRTTDAATLAGVSELTSNNEQASIDRAVEYLRLNGYNIGGLTGDSEVLVRGCIDPDGPGPAGPRNVNEAGPYTGANPMAKANTITGALYIASTVNPPKATFMIDTGSYQAVPGNCTSTPASYGGNAQKLQVAGKVNVHMSFMQFFGFRDVPVADEAVAENLTTLDIVVVFDISGSMEDQTNCIDCWVRTTYGITSTPYPGNGYFNPIPFDRTLAPGDPNQSVPLSRLCTDPPTPWLQQNGAITYSYLTVEAELYSANVGNWNLNARTAGQGFWAIQRGSAGSNFPPGVDSADENGERQGNQAGNPNNQSSNVCNPALPGSIDCKIGPTNSDDVCTNDPGADVGIVDCSAYISARPFQSYGQRPGSIPNPNGATYNVDCFKSGVGPFNSDPFAADGVYSFSCWTNARTTAGQDGYNPFYDPVNGPLTDPGPSNVPWVEYDFTPTWAGNTYIWIRAIGGGDQSYTYGGPSPDDLDGTPNNNLSGWRKVIFWQIGNGQVNVQNDNSNGTVQTWGDWRDTRADATDWRWVKLGSTATISGVQSTLKLYQGSPGYKVDKIIFTNDSNGSTGNPPPAMRRRLNGSLANSPYGQDAFGPPVSYGSLTREACNLCNPIYGNTVNQSLCSCLKNTTEVNQRYTVGYPGYNPGLYGSGTGCSSVPPGAGSTSLLANVISMTVSPPEVQPPQVQTRTVVNDLYSSMQPMRSAQEAVKNFVLGIGVEEQYRLKPGFDQVGFVSFTADTGGYARSKLQCLRRQVPPSTDPVGCYADVLTAVEKQWPNWGTNIGEGMREGLEELGLSIGNNTNVDHTCTAPNNDKHACDRSGAAKRVLILMTDGSPNASPNGCTTQPGYADFWEGLIGNGNTHFECAMWYAQQAAAKGVIVYTIGIGGGANGDFLTAMATGTDPHGGAPIPMFPGVGGQYFPAAQPSDLDGIFRIILTSVSVRIVG
jgi:hypothetical protein